MYIPFIFHKFELFCTILLSFVALIGDFLVSYTNDHIYKALFDNSTHCLIGALTWYVVTLKFKNKPVLDRLIEVFICALFASLIDADHFITAKSLKLKDATNLQGRPFLHCSTIPVILTVVLIILSKFFISEIIYRFAWIVFAAFASHHIRDSTRKGLWFYYLGSTRPLPYFLYIALTMVIPHVVVILMKQFHVEYNSHITAYSNIVDI